MKGEALKHELLAHPALSDYLHGLWSQMIVWIQGDLAGADSSLRRQVALGTRSLGEKLGADAAMKGWIDEQIRVSPRAGSSAIARTSASTSSPACASGMRPR